MSAGGRLIVVSNRLPVVVDGNDGMPRLRPSCGGLVTALEPVLRDAGGCWVGWTGTEADPAISCLLREHAPGSYSLAPVFLTATEKACFYHGCSNEIIWPLFHDLQSRCHFEPAYWQVYCEVNEKFADAVESAAGKDDFVWVHDYHLMMLGDSLRARDLRLKLGYFHHIPFPAPDIFEKLPWRKEILRGLLQFNIVGFQTTRDRRNFVASVRHCLRDVDVQQLGEKLLVRAEGLCTTAGTFPISIDFREFDRAARSPEVAAEALEIQAAVAGAQIILGVDRLDYTKGIPERLRAYAALLKRYAELRGRVTMIQVVVPSREEIPEYRALKTAIESLVNDINGRYGCPGWTPVHYLHRCLSRPELLAFYRAANIAFLTPLKDGMNLVAKEFCAARAEEDGVLVLSEFAGAAIELGSGALLVNPYDTEGAVAALYRALRMSIGEQRARMQSMRGTVKERDVFRWCELFCAQAGAARLRQPPAMNSAVREPLRAASQAIA